MDGESWETIFGESGYLNSAYKLVKDVESAYRIMGMPEVVAYAVMKVSMVCRTIYTLTNTNLAGRH